MIHGRHQNKAGFGLLAGEKQAVLDVSLRARPNSGYRLRRRVGFPAGALVVAPARTGQCRRDSPFCFSAPKPLVLGDFPCHIICTAIIIFGALPQQREVIKAPGWTGGTTADY